jgi:hypothetical protein
MESWVSCVMDRIATAMRRSPGNGSSLAYMRGRGGLMFERTICLDSDSDSDSVVVLLRGCSALCEGCQKCRNGREGGTEKEVKAVVVRVRG